MVLNCLDKLPFQKKAAITLASGFVLHFILGTFYMWGSISTYITSYLKHDGQDYTKEDVGAVFPFTLLAINIGTPFGPYIAQRVGFRLLIFICSLVLGVVVIISSFFIKVFPVFVLLYGFVFGLPCGILYMVPFNTCYLYYPKKKGLVSGVITAGFGFGATAFIWVMYAIINPDNEKATFVIGSSKYFSEEVCDRLPNAIKILGVIQIVAACLSSIFHLRPTQEELQKEEKAVYQMTHVIVNNATHHDDHSPPAIHAFGSNNHTDHHDDHHQSHAHDGIHDDHHHDEHPINAITMKSDQHSNDQNDKIIKPSAPTSSNSNNTNNSGNSIQEFYEFQSFKDGMKTKFIYLSVFITLLYSAYGAMTVANYKLYGEYLGYEDSFLSAAGTAGSVFNGVSRFFWGSLMEKFTIKKIIFSNLALQMIISFTYRWAATVQGLYFLYVILGYFVYGGWYSVMPTLITRIYGKKIGTSIYGVTFVGFSLASFTQFFIVKIVQEAIGWGDMFWVFTGIQALAVISTCLVTFNAKPPKDSIQASISQK